MEFPIMQEIVVIFALSIVILLLCHRLNLPAVVGFLLTGVICGPHCLALISDVDDVKELATLGIVLLLFSVGMDFSIKNIVKYRVYFFGGGVLQVLLTVLSAMGIAFFVFGQSLGEALFWGFLLSLSSTAIVLRALEEMGQSDTPQGRLVLGILIFQDVIAIPMMLLIPLLAGTGAGGRIEAKDIYVFAAGLLCLFAMAFIAFRAVPRLLYYVARTKSRELFLLSVLTICFSVAWASSSIGLSLSLGAFFAGLVISESEYSDEAIGHVLPFQEIFTSFFFVSMGMLLDVSFAIKQPALILALTLAALSLKAVIAAFVARLMRMSWQPALTAGLALSQVGEFSLVLAHAGMDYGLMLDYYYQLFLAVTLLTMSLTPAVMRASPYLGLLFAKLQGSRKGEESHEGMRPCDEASQSHMIIVGFGLRGQYLAQAAKEHSLPYLILEINPETVRMQKAKGEPIRYGDPSHAAVLLHAGIKKAKVLAVVINDPLSTKRIIQLAKELNPEVHAITRTRYIVEAPQLCRLGAREVIADELSSALEVYVRVLQKYDIAQEEIVRGVQKLRSESEHQLQLSSVEVMYRSFGQRGGGQNARIESFRLSPASPFVGKTIVDSQLKKLHGLTVLWINRQDQLVADIQAETTMEARDTLVVYGLPENLAKAKNLLAC